MSFINKPGKTRSWRKMVTRQQVSDVIAYNQISTTLTKAKETQRHVERLVTIAKKNNLAAIRKAESILLDTTNLSKSELIKKLFDKIAPLYKDVNGGYTRVLKTGPRTGDNTETAILQFTKNIK